VDQNQIGKCILCSGCCVLIAIDVQRSMFLESQLEEASDTNRNLLRELAAKDAEIQSYSKKLRDSLSTEAEKQLHLQLEEIETYKRDLLNAKESEALLLKKLDKLQQEKSQCHLSLSY
jgi:predicted RNase H-like nuclease (RuvC/YqgF family)